MKLVAPYYSEYTKCHFIVHFKINTLCEFNPSFFFFFRKDHILRYMKFKNTRDKEKILKISREKQRISYCIINHNKLNNNVVINKP